MYLGGAPTFTSFATGTIIVVAVAMLGSLTVLPARDVAAGRPASTAAASPASTGSSAGWPRFGLWSRDRRPRHAPPAAVGGRRRPLLLVARRDPGDAACTPARRHSDTLPQELASCRRSTACRPRSRAETSALSVVVKANDVTAPAVTARHRASSSGRARSDPDLFPGEPQSRWRSAPDKTVATLDDRDRRRRPGRSVEPRRSTSLRDDLVPATIGKVDGRRGRTSSGLTGEERDFNDTMIVAPAARLRVRDRRGVPAAAGHVPLDRRADQGDRPEPAVGRRGVRRAGAGLPARLVQEPARVQADRPDRRLAAAVHVRGPVRPVDGLPRVHPQPGPRARRPRHEDRGRGVVTRSRARRAS